ncbi:MAG TPA: DnaJ C-terminal domain-containing protein [Ktedonobacteraceae bacterium]|jgi:type II secretory pathway pseudopilin PulG
MAFGDQQPEDMRATLAISEEEARSGSSRVINLPGGRTTTVVVPAGTRAGQELRLPGLGLASDAGGPSGDLVLRISVIASQNFNRSHDDYTTERAPYSTPNAAAPFDYAEGARGFGGPVGHEQHPPFSSPDMLNGGAPGQPPFSGSQPYGGYQGNAAYSPVAAPAQQQPYPGAGGYQSNAAYSPVAIPQNYPTPPPRPKRGGAMTTFIVVIVLLLIVGSGLIYYLGYYKPNQVHVTATQTAQAQTTATAHSAATGTAQITQATAQTAATSTAQAQATAQTYQTIYTQATSGTPIVNDPLSSPTFNPLWDITIGSITNGDCAFTQGSYHSTIPTSDYFEPCYALNTNYSNFAFQVDMTITQGDFGGVLLRANTAHSEFYLFRIGVDDSFALYNYANSQGSQAALLLTGSSNAMKGLNQSNEITVVARQTTMYFYLNRQYLGSSNDNSYTAGEIGVFAESMKNPTDVAFSNAKVWKL